VILERLISHVPDYLDKDPAAVPGLTLLYTGGTGSVTITRRTLTTVVTNGQSLAIPLTGLTLQSLATQIRAHTGYTALTPGTETSPALLLSEVEAVDLIVGARLLWCSAFLWRLLAPIAWAIEDSLTNVAAGVRQMALPSADGAFVDFWASYYGGLLRRLNETDRAFALRVILEVLRVRLNARAIEQIVLDELGVRVTIRNLSDDAWIISTTKFGYLAGRKYSPTTFLVTVDSTGETAILNFDELLAYLVNHNRAAGTLPYFLRRNFGGVVNTSTESVWTDQNITTSSVISTPLIWQISDTRLGETWLSLANNTVGIVTVVTTPVDPLNPPDLILGVTEIGLSKLG
jgi:hypothetical protein